MDKKTIFAFLLIGIILIVTQTKFYRDLVLPKRNLGVTENVVDSTRVSQDSITVAPIAQQKIIPDSDNKASAKPLVQKSSLASLFQAPGETAYETVSIETDKYVAQINPKGAVISNWRLKQYKYNTEESVQLIQGDGYGNLGIFFINDEDTIYTYDSLFKPEKTKIQFEPGQLSDSVTFVLDLGQARQLIKKFKFYRDQYIIDLHIEIKNLATQFDNQQYYLSWNSGLAYTELDYSNHIDKEDINNAKAYVFQGGSKEELNLPNKPFEKRSRSDFSGVVDWAAIRTKYFAMIIIPDNDQNIEPILFGKTLPLYKDDRLKDRVDKRYSITLKSIISPDKNNWIAQRFRVYIGPMDYDIIKKYHPTLVKLMDLGGSVIRPFAKLVLRSFIFLHSLIPNYGIVLILFAILIKILTHPLTRKSYVSMQRMQQLQPKLNELKTKYSDEPQRLNKETMKMYKEEGINPLGGCLPTLLQLPLLWAVFIVFRNTIELRDASFFWWIKDLSAPDTILQLPFSIPFYGDLLNVLPLVMGVTMFIQQKMTMKDPKQKAMVYFMPVFLTLLFNSFPSGLNLYYTLFNLFSIIQQKWVPVKDSADDVNKNEKLKSSQKLKNRFLLPKRR